MPSVNIGSMTSQPVQEKLLPPVTDKREAILRAALEVFAEHGVHGVAVPEIASRARVGTGTIYRYFESKEVLVNELFREQKLAFGRRLRENLDTRIEPRALFNEIWARLVAFAREEPASYRFLELQDHLSYLDTKSCEVEREVLSFLASSVRAAQKNGAFRSDIRAEVLMAVTWGAFVNLFKAEHGGYIKLDPQDISAARDACWRMCVAPSAENT